MTPVPCRVVRVALTQTVNAYAPMPASVEVLATLSDRLDDIRRVNVDHHVALIEAAVAQGAQVVSLGELFTAPYFALGRESVWMAMAEDALDGPTISTLRRVAKRLHTVLIAPIYEMDPHSSKRFNTAVVIDATGDVLGTYRKSHIPEGANEQGSFFETLYYDRSDGRCRGSDGSPGQDAYFPVFATTVGRVGVAICYDRHFEGVIRALAIGGAEMVFSPAVTFGAKSQRMWRLEFAVDAARHNVYIGGSNRLGAESPWNQPYFGDSHVVGPDGPLENRSTHPNLVIADLPLDRLSRPDNSGWNLPRDARPDIFVKAQSRGISLTGR